LQATRDPAAGRATVVASATAADGNRDGNVRSQRQPAAGSQTLLLDRAELAIRHT